MKTIEGMELDLEALKEAAGGEDFVTDVCDSIHGAFVTMMRRAKASGQTFDQFMNSLFGKRLPEEVMRNLRAFWDSL